MNYREALNFLFGLRRHPPKPGTEATERVLDVLGSPHEELRCVQVAGSNGKGSTVRMCESICRADGRRVGRYTSPHLDDLRERVRIDGRPIPKHAVTGFVEAVRPAIEEHAATGEPTTFFEATTAMAYWWFAERAVDVAVVEVGIGGRRDATSVIDPVASCVTNVALEHTDVLGDTVEEIARDKAHVAPDRDGGTTPLVTAAEGPALEAIRDVAPSVLTVGETATDVTVTYHGRAGHEAHVSIAGDGWEVDTRTPLLGRHQALNAGVAAALARQFGIEPPVIERGLRGAHWPGRFEIVERDPLVVLDGAHNPGACAELAAVLNSFAYDRLHLVVGAMADKDLAGMASALPDADQVVACRPDRDRAADEDVIASAFSTRESPPRSIDTRQAVGDAVGDALDAADPADAVLVTGSLYTVAEARERWATPMVPTRTTTLPSAERTLERADVTRAGIGHMRGKAVHRTVRTRVRQRQAEYLKQTLLALGGECAIGGPDDRTERCEVALMGTVEQLRRLARTLDDQPFDLQRVADQVRSVVDEATHSGRLPGTTENQARDPDSLPWSERPAIMGILNVTPDSFHDGGAFEGTERAVDRAREMVDAGAAIVDVGGESTRPGADPVPVETEIDRVVPVIERLADSDVAISVDTRKAAVAEAALDAGADIVNDVSGLGDPAMAPLVAEREVPIVLMHSLDAPVDPDRDPQYDDVVGDVRSALHERLLDAERAGIDRSRILLDPGLGFGKSAADSFALLDRIDELRALGAPVVVGHSHKSMFERVGYGPDERTHATVGATALAVDRGADVIRVHDVRENLAALRAVRGAAGWRPDDAGG